MGGAQPTYVSGACGSASAPGAIVSCGAAAVLTAATTGLSVVREPRLVRERFEEDVRALLRARSVALRDDHAESPIAHRPDTVSLELPLASAERRTRLEAVFDGSRRIDSWTRQVLEAGAHVAALLLELERAQGRQPARHRDGAAPLIGSSLAIQKVRERIERVAATDFTVLVEGSSRR
jgi:transcriptional regulator with GAF, ATPase, and Fis domain